MKRSLALSAAAFALMLALPALAQNSQAAPKLTPPPPPPGLNDPGPRVGGPDTSGMAPIPRPVPYDSSTEAAAAAASSSAPPPHSATDLPAMQDDGGAPHDAGGKAPPQVSVHKQGDDTVEEYRQGGRLYMVRITPKNGIPQTYMADESGKLRHDERDGPVSPVYYKIYEWGAPPKTSSEQQNDQ
jgi:Protein of unknown function (DUF2782)